MISPAIVAACGLFYSAITQMPEADQMQKVYAQDRARQFAVYARNDLPEINKRINMIVYHFKQNPGEWLGFLEAIGPECEQIP